MYFLYDHELDVKAINKKIIFKIYKIMCFSAEE